MTLYKLPKKNDPFVNLDVWLGKKHNVSATVSENIYITVPKRKKKNIKAVIEYYGPIEAPIAKGDKIGSLKVYVLDELKKETDILSGEDIKRANIFTNAKIFIDCSNFFHFHLFSRINNKQRTS